MTRSLFIQAATALSAVILLGSVASAKRNSFVCLHQDKPGAWGALDVGCDADQFGDISRIETIYPDFVYDRRFNDEEYEKHIRVYITNINAVVRKIAKEYYLARIPDAKPRTLEGWMDAAVAVAAHESQLSHYRIAEDGRYKLMTGDHLVSHGIMQVNQNYHANKDLDSSFDLVGNVVGGLDTYFVEWNRAIENDCWKTANGKGATLESMLQNRARSAYSAYNGGQGKLCRYLDKKDRWANNDVRFLESIHERPWMKWVTDPKMESPLNTKCLVAGDDLCAMAKPARDKAMTARPILFADGKTCVTADGTNFTCANDMRIFSCLAKIDPDVLDNDPIKMDKAPSFAKITTVTDREPLCEKAVQGLFKVGTTVIARNDMLIRESIGGSPQGSAIIGRTYQILDYDLRLGGKTERYYKIKTTAGTEGWIFGGDDKDHATWLETATDADVASSVAAVEKAKADRTAKRDAEKKERADALAKIMEGTRAAAEAEAAKPSAGDIVVTAPRATPTATPAPAAPATVAAATDADDDSADDDQKRRRNSGRIAGQGFDHRDRCR